MESFTELIPGLPEEIALECLTRMHYNVHEVASHVCQRWRRLFKSREFYYHRKQYGFTNKTACFVQSLPVQPVQAEFEREKQGVNSSKPESQPKYGLSIFEPCSHTWEQLNPVQKYPDGLPVFCQVESTEGKLVMMGGWNPGSWEPLRDVFVYDFTTRQWTQRKDLPSNRSFFAAGALDGKIYVAGGHDESKNALKSAWVYDINSDQWSELAHMSEPRDECEGVFIGSDFWVISGYDTDTQGQFKNSAEVLDTITGKWRRVEGAWGLNKCPRGCAKAGQNGNFTCFSDMDPAIQVGSCGVDLGDRTLVTGSACQGGPQTFFIAMKNKQGQKCKLHKVDAPDEFSGFVQSGCFVEI
ncbi:Galactose oxidase, beta-propeller [Artemisia annua]|uniref:Galactose oxidase, beta-propeller n=1 Tax=Artemisia annua TaxID=35608 RepID=A0A2U1PAZ8_ARTAN|nr:Galactose oxidase, beta-propeller [Artemisia annua]